MEAVVHREVVTAVVVSVAAAVVAHTLAVRDPMEAEAAVMVTDKEVVAAIEEVRFIRCKFSIHITKMASL